MKKFALLFISCCIVSFNSIGQNLKEFKSLLADCGIIFELPANMIEPQIFENGDMNYEYALKLPDKDFEVRYAIRPIRYLHYANDTVREESESQRPFRNSQYLILFQTVMNNITGGIDYKYSVFDSASVKNEFNADWGATSFVDLRSEFGKGYKYCMMVTIHKDDVADIYYFYLSNTKENFSENMNAFFYSLKFSK